MRKPIYLGLYLVLLFSFLWSCEKEIPLETQDLFVAVQNQTFNTTIQKDLEDLITLVSKEQIKTIEDARLITAVDSEGEFYVITAKLINAVDQKISLSIPLIQMNTKNNEGSHAVVGCTMICTPSNGCRRCDQVIHERCKKQSCSCSLGDQSYGCSSSITFIN